ncbi:MAG: histidine kinase dimerization/phospho-acceptor domain-containing protein, partial [Blastocatellia bacterium]
VVGLSVAQYRSLAELESKTRVAGQEQLRQTLQTLMRRTREKLETLAAASLGGIEAAEIEQDAPATLERRLAGIREAYPQIDDVFVVSHCSCRSYKFALFATADGLRRVDRDQFKKHPQTETVVALYSNAGLLQAAAGLKKEGIVFEQSCSLFSGKEDEHAQLFVFSPLRGADGHKHYGFAGMTLKPGYVKTELLQQVASELLPGSGKNGSPVISVVDDHQREIYASHGGLKQHEISMSFTPIFRRWKLGIGFPDTTIARLARRQYQQNLLFTALALALLGGGLLLALRAALREMRLAAAKSAFVSNVSHELKTPLALIRLFAETLEMGRVKSPEKAEEYYR